MSTPSDPNMPQQMGDAAGTTSNAIGSPTAARPTQSSPPAGGGNGGDGGQRAQETASAVADEGKAVAGTVAEQARSVADTAKGQVATVSEEAKTQAQRVLGDAAHELQSQVEQRVSDVSGRARTTSEQPRALAEGRTDEAGPAPDWARQASDRLEQFSSRLDNMGLEGATQEVTRFARQRPLVFLAGAATAGFLLGRTFRNASGGTGNGGGARAGTADRQIPAGYGDGPDIDLANGTGSQPLGTGADVASPDSRITASISSTGAFG